MLLVGAPSISLSSLCLFLYLWPPPEAPPRAVLLHGRRPQLVERLDALELRPPFLGGEHAVLGPARGLPSRRRHGRRRLVHERLPHRCRRRRRRCRCCPSRAAASAAARARSAGPGVGVGGHERVDDGQELLQSCVEHDGVLLFSLFLLLLSGSALEREREKMILSDEKRKRREKTQTENTHSSTHSPTPPRAPAPVSSGPLHRDIFLAFGSSNRIDEERERE